MPWLPRSGSSGSPTTCSGASRRRRRPTGRTAGFAVGVLLLLILGFGMFYGGVMGTYGGLAGDRSLQLLYSAIKVPFLIMTTFALSVPSFYVVNSAAGPARRFRPRDPRPS